MDHKEQQDRFLDERGLEPGVLRRHRSPGAELPQPDLHHTSGQSGDSRGAISLPRPGRQLQGVRAFGAEQHLRYLVGIRPNPWDLDLNRQVLRCAIHRLGCIDQRRIAAWDEPDPHPRRLPPGPEHQRHAARLGGARPRISNARPQQRRRVHDGHPGEGHADLGDHLRRRPHELTRVAAGRQRSCPK